MQRNWIFESEGQQFMELLLVNSKIQFSYLRDISLFTFLFFYDRWKKIKLYVVYKKAKPRNELKFGHCCYQLIQTEKYAGINKKNVVSKNEIFYRKKISKSKAEYWIFLQLLDVCMIIICNKFHCNCNIFSVAEKLMDSYSFLFWYIKYFQDSWIYIFMNEFFRSPPNFDMVNFLVQLASTFSGQKIS